MTTEKAQNEVGRQGRDGAGRFGPVGMRVECELHPRHVEPAAVFIACLRPERKRSETESVMKLLTNGIGMGDADVGIHDALSAQKVDQAAIKPPSPPFAPVFGGKIDAELHRPTK